MSGLQKSMKVNVFEAGVKIDEAIVYRVGTGENSRTNEIETESLQLQPGIRTEFAFIQHSDPAREGWRILFEDPMAGGRCFSQRAPTFTFEPIS